MLRLEPKKQFTLPVTSEFVSPDALTGKTLTEIKELTIWEGNKQKTLGELFQISETGEKSPEITIIGDLSKVRRIGAGMESGELVIHGNVGEHLGEEMKGGRITVYGNVAGWACSMMAGGSVEIHGNMSDYLAAPYRGSNRGMHDGNIIVHGNVGNEAGAHMKRGTIRIRGNAGQFAGFRMKDGTMCIEGNCSSRVGACMVGGKIIVIGTLESVLPTFTFDSVKPRVKVEEDQYAMGPFYVFLGDRVEQGDGKLYVSKNKNPQLKTFEKFLEEK